MAEITQLIQQYNVDFASNNNFLFIKTVEGDGYNTRCADITLTNNGQAYELDPENVRAIIRGQKADGKIIFNECEIIEPNTIRMEITSQMSSVPGKSDYEISIMSTKQNRIITSFPFHIIVEASVFDVEGVVSSNEFHVLTRKIHEVDELHEVSEVLIEDQQALKVELKETIADSIVATEDSRQATSDLRAYHAVVEEAENQRIENENERIENEDTRITTENQRIADEDIRIATENQRIIDESIRKENEDQRKLNEEERQSNEFIRIDTENQRIADEDIRIESENQRISNENTRITTEDQRIIDENIRKENEVTRQSNEEIRLSNEDIRKENENIRIETENQRIADENIRQENEVIRITSENERIESEETRKNNEEVRVTNENTRISAENERISSEETRELNEETRKANEEARILTEIDRLDQLAAVTAAEEKRAEAEEIRQQQEEARQEASATAVTNAEVATENANHAVEAVMDALGIDDNPDPEDAMFVAYSAQKVQALFDTRYATLLLSDWNEEAPYIQTISVDGLKDGYRPTITPVVNHVETETEKKQILKSFGFIEDIEIGNGILTATCKFKKPIIDIPLTIKGA